MSGAANAAGSSGGGSTRRSNTSSLARGIATGVYEVASRSLQRLGNLRVRAERLGNGSGVGDGAGGMEDSLGISPTGAGSASSSDMVPACFQIVGTSPPNTMGVSDLPVVFEPSGVVPQGPCCHHCLCLYPQSHAWSELLLQWTFALGVDISSGEQRRLGSRRLDLSSCLPSHTGTV